MAATTPDRRTPGATATIYITAANLESDELIVYEGTGSGLGQRLRRDPTGKVQKNRLLNKD